MSIAKRLEELQIVGSQIYERMGNECASEVTPTRYAYWACSCRYTSLRRCLNRRLAQRSSALVAVDQDGGIAQQTLSAHLMRGQAMTQKEIRAEIPRDAPFGQEPDGTIVLYIGAKNWPTPILLVNEGSSWYFDTDAGKKETLLRRIGGNKLKIWWTRGDSNPRPPRCERGALPAELLAHE
jgi:hypothetical protein